MFETVETALQKGHSGFALLLDAARPEIYRRLNLDFDETPANVNVLLRRLMEKGPLYRIRKGHDEYTAAKFRDYLLRRAVDEQSGSTSLF